MAPRAAKMSAAPRVPHDRPLARRPSCPTGAFLEDPGVAVGIVEEAVSGLVQRQEHGAQAEGAHSLGGRASVVSHTAVMFDCGDPTVIGPMDTIGDAEVIRPGSDQS
jgi:hypothetical protein